MERRACYDQSSCTSDHFALRLVRWYADFGRSFPWRHSCDPYSVLMAVFMLQRTGVSQVMNVYEDFLERFPDLSALRGADQEELVAALKPLGRTGRVRVLTALVDTLSTEYNGRIPAELKELESLPGVGQYSARALLVIAFQRPYIMLDPNSYRVLHRACGTTSACSRPHADRKMIRQLDAIVPSSNPVEYNLALLDIGATSCRARRPVHEVCPLTSICAFHESKHGGRVPTEYLGQVGPRPTL